MCGIIGYTGSEEALPILYRGLSTLEYRGYDSAGVSVAKDSEGFVTVKTQGRLSDLGKKLREGTPIVGSTGIGHTRWATHGVPSDRNAHPHETEHLVLVHNGIIENDAELAVMLSEKGYSFRSETDTEKAAALIDFCYKETGDPVTAIFRAVSQMRGAYAFAMIFRDLPDRIYCIRKDSPLVVSATEHGCLLASDVPAILDETKSYYRPREGLLTELSGARRQVRFLDEGGREVEVPMETANFTVDAAKKGGYPFFMLKEIHEEPEAIRKTVASRLRDDLPHFGIPLLDEDERLARVERIHIVACGTAMHAGLVGKSWIERFARVPCDVEIASEFRYRDPILGERDLVILLSQSGETSDTLAALRHAKKQGVRTLGIVNVVGSAVAREADDVLYTYAGPEIAVASTKAYSVQCAILYLIALRMAMCRGKLLLSEVTRLTRALLKDTPEAVEAVFSQMEAILKTARTFLPHDHVFYIGRKLDAALATEASLKLKEISYIHSEAYAAGELKHGTISLVTEGVPIVAVLSERDVAEKTISGIREVISRGGDVTAVVTDEIARQFTVPAGRIIAVETLPGGLSLFPMVTVLQLLAYHTAAEKGLDVDKPRNLAKSVTVE